MKIRDKVLPVLKPLADQSDIDDIAETMVGGVEDQKWKSWKKILLKWLVLNMQLP